MADTESDKPEPDGDEGLDESAPENADPSASSDDADVSDDDVDGSGRPDHDPADKSDHDVYVDRDKIDFDPDDGLLSGTAIEGGTDIPGPHESVDDVVPEDGDSDGSEESDDGDGSDQEAGSTEESGDDEES